MPILKEYVLINDKELLIGKGIGATHSHNSIDIFRGAVDKSFGFLEISIFSIPALLVELGIIGFLIYLLFFIRLSFIFIRDYKKTKEAQPLMIIFITMLFMWYNNSILNSFYIIFFTGVLLSINYKRYLERNNKCYHL